MRTFQISTATVSLTDTHLDRSGVPYEPSLTLASLSQDLRVLWDERGQVKEVVIQQLNSTTQLNRVGVEWSQAILEVNARHNLSAERLTQR